MNAHEKALEAAIHVWTWIGEATDREIFEAQLHAYLSALPPSVVVDGKAVDLAEALSAAFAVPIEGSSLIPDLASDIFRGAKGVAGE